MLMINLNLINFDKIILKCQLTEFAIENPEILASF